MDPTSSSAHPALKVPLTCPQELGQPVQCMRTGRGNSSCSSSFVTTAIARFLVSMMARGQNWAPVQDTRPRSKLPAVGGGREDEGSQEA